MHPTYKFNNNDSPAHAPAHSVRPYCAREKPKKGVPGEKKVRRRDRFGLEEKTRCPFIRVGVMFTLVCRTRFFRNSMGTAAHIIVIVCMRIRFGWK